MKVLGQWGIQCCLPSTRDSLLLQWSGIMQAKFQRLAQRLISSSTIWGIWLLRNNIVFQEGTISLFDYFSTICHRVAIWLLVLDSSITYTGNDLLRSIDGIKLWCNKKSQLVIFGFSSSFMVSLFLCSKPTLVSFSFLCILFLSFSKFVPFFYPILVYCFCY